MFCNYLNLVILILLFLIIVIFLASYAEFNMFFTLCLGNPTGEELIDNASSTKVSAETMQFSCGSHFYEEVEDTKDSAWLVQVIMNDEDKPLLSKSVWKEVVHRVSGFGIRTGHFKCSLDKRYIYFHLLTISYLNK